MIRKIFPFILAFLLAVFIVTPALADKSYHAENFDVNLELQSGGTMLVTETVEFRFDGGPFTYAFREVSKTGTDGVTFLDANMDGVPMQPGTSAGQVEVQDGDPLKITWHFAPTSDATHVFVVRYRVEGVIRTGAADTLIWRVIPEEHEYPIAKSTITLDYPTGVRPQNAPTLDRTFDSAPTDSGIKLIANDIGKNDSLTLTAKFPSGSLAQTTPQWQMRQEQENAATTRILPFGFFTGLATLILGGLGLLFTIRADARELNLPEQVLLATLPADVPPAIVGQLTGQAQNFMGTLFDLAQRGVLEVREEKNRWGITSHILMRKEMKISLNPHEQSLLDTVFLPGATKVNLSEVTTQLAYKTHLFNQLWDQELIQRGWLDPERKQKRLRLGLAGLFGVFLAMGLFILGVVLSGVFMISNPTFALFATAFAGICGAAFVLSIPLLVYWAIYSPLTPEGEVQKVRWQGFAKYLKLVSQGKEPALRVDTFEHYLPYAAVFGLGADWTKVFQKLGGVPLPVWFHALAGSDGDFGAMVTMMAVSDTAGYTGGADGGGGASGGGSSGAG
jgi:hypothetical protein